MRIRFVQNHKVKQGDGHGPEYKAGEEYTFTDAVAQSYARKYVARGYAVEVTAETAVPAIADAPAADGPPTDAPPTDAPAIPEAPVAPFRAKKTRKGTDQPTGE